MYMYIIVTEWDGAFINTDSSFHPLTKNSLWNSPCTLYSMYMYIVLVCISYFLTVEERPEDTSTGSIIVSEIMVSLKC